MENKEFVEKIRDMVAEGKTEKSLDVLYQFVRDADNELLDELVMLRNRMKHLQRDIQMGTLDDDSANQERARINETILVYLRKMTPADIAMSTGKGSQYSSAASAGSSGGTSASSGGNMKYLYLGGGVILLLLILALSGVFSGGSSAEGGDKYKNEKTEQWAMVKTRTKDNLRIRALPNQTSDIVVSMPHGSKVKILKVDDKFVRVAGERGKWIKVQYKAADKQLYVGWAWGGFLKILD